VVFNRDFILTAIKNRRTRVSRIAFAIKNPANSIRRTHCTRKCQANLSIHNEKTKNRKEGVLN